jgi:hypothetical protein
MTNGNDPANPHEDQDSCGNPIRRNAGLTKREVFAAMALNGVASDRDTSIESAARAAVEYADALIAALNKGPQS